MLNYTLLMNLCTFFGQNVHKFAPLWAARARRTILLFRHHAPDLVVLSAVSMRLI